MTTRILGILVFIALLIVHLGSSNRFRDSGESSVDWEKGYITATVTSTVELTPEGIPVDHYGGERISLNRARMEAYSHAREEALERMVSTIKKLRVDAWQNVGGVIEAEESTRGRISEALVHTLTVREKPAGFYGSSCEIRISFGDIITSLPFEFPERDFPKREDAVVPTDYTGLIIDGRGLPIETMLYPSVFSETGLEIYGRAFVSGRHAAATGMAAYCFNENEAMKHRRAGRRPYYTTALRSLNGCPVISDRDARRILGSPATLSHLKKCNVIIIINGREDKRSVRRTIP